MGIFTIYLNVKEVTYGLNLFNFRSRQILLESHIDFKKIRIYSPKLVLFSMFG